MSQEAECPTIFFEPDFHQALRYKAATTNQSLSALVNQAVREDQEDLAALEERESEPTLSYEELLTDPQAHGRL